ncbi:MAG: DUF3987 domain-containing protein [Bacteroidaceae bacterium]|nr:DUF3987 domain-containing protein [Bacteroidaceae bacterium]
MNNNILAEALFNVSQQHPDFIPNDEFVNDLSSKYGDLSCEAGRLFPDDDEAWKRYIIDRYTELLLQEYDKQQPHFPLDLCGEFAESIAKSVAKAYNVSTDMVLAAMFAAIGTAVGDKIKVRHGNYTNSLALWWCMIAPSGYGKTEPTKKILQPLHDINKAMVAKTSSALAEWKFNKQQGERPRKSQIIVSDTTPEALSELLSDNPAGLLVYRDELAGFFNDIGRYNNSGEVENYLSMWSGQGFSVNRKTQDPLFVDAPVLGILGGMQPARLADAFSSRGMMDNGFFARWCFVYPDVMISTTFQQQELSRDIKEKWALFVDALHDDNLQPRTFTLDEAAARLHESFYVQIAKEMNDERTTERRREVLAKLRVMVFRLAGVIHLLRNGFTAASLIDEVSMKAAIYSVNAVKQWNYKALALVSDRKTKMSKGELLIAVRSMFPKMNVTQFCEAVGMSRDTFNYYFRK